MPSGDMIVKPAMEKEAFLTKTPVLGVLGVERYLKKSEKLTRVFLLIDSRHEPSANDKMMFEWIVHNGFRPVIIATKSDKLKKTEKEKNKRIIRDALDMQKEDILIMVSSAKKEGIEEVWKEILT